MDDTTTRELTDEDIRTVMPDTGRTGTGTGPNAETDPDTMDGDGTDGKDADGTDTGDMDGTDSTS